MIALPEQTLPAFVFAAILVITLVIISWIDVRRLIIPDALNAILAVSGLCYQGLVGVMPIWSHIIGALSLCGLMYGLRYAFVRRIGLVGLGLGDVKFVGAAAMWVSPLLLPTFILIASASALCFVLIARFAHAGFRQQERIPFAPFLSASLLTVWASEVFRLPIDLGQI